MFATIATTALLALSASTTSMMAMESPYCPDTLCNTVEMEAHAHNVLEDSGYTDRNPYESVNFIGYIDALEYTESINDSTIQITDGETTYVFSSVYLYPQHT